VNLKNYDQMILVDVCQVGFSILISESFQWNADNSDRISLE
jgi:hypothetical protein